MKVRLMYKDRDMISDEKHDKDDILSDLSFKRIIKAMAVTDETIEEMCMSALLSPETSIDTIRYRQDILSDSIKCPEMVRDLYSITIDVEEKLRGAFFWLDSNYLSSTFSSAVGRLIIYVEALTKIRKIADERIDDCSSEGFKNLFSMCQRELSDDYIKEVTARLTELRSNEGRVISAVPGKDLCGTGYVLREKDEKGAWRKWAFAPSYTIADRDDVGAKDIGNKCDRAINEPANVLAQSAEHLEGFFRSLRRELSFYVGCLNLSDKLQSYGMPICIPEIEDERCCDREYKELYDISLALTKKELVVGNTMTIADKRLYMITGANQGGKTTFLRSIGQSQIMAQSGMFVGASECTIPLREGIFTHFKKEEDSEIKSGKLDEELSRMDDISSRLKEHSMILFNESFSSTNEREGSEICSQITRALVESGIEVFSVTHLYHYAVSFSGNENALFLRAERKEDGERTFHISEGMPLHTAYGKDLYERIERESQSYTVAEQGPCIFDEKRRERDTERD